MFKTIPKHLKVKLGEKKVCGLIGGSKILSEHKYDLMIHKEE